MQFALREVSVHFGPVIALDRVSFRFPTRGMIALIGENGAGKSTALDVLSGFIGHTSGEVVNSETGRHESRSWLRNHCARLHQSVVLPNELTPGAYLNVVRFPQRAKWICDTGRAKETNLTETIPEPWALLLDKASVDVRRPIALHSWGQQRAVALAAVLMVQKQVLLLDEPFSSLSGRVFEHASHLVQNEAQRRLVIFAEHDIPHAMETADTVLVLKAGQLKAVVPGKESHYSEILRYFG